MIIKRTTGHGRKFGIKLAGELRMAFVVNPLFFKNRIASQVEDGNVHNVQR